MLQAKGLQSIDGVGLPGVFGRRLDGRRREALDRELSDPAEPARALKSGCQLIDMAGGGERGDLAEGEGSQVGKESAEGGVVGGELVEAESVEDERVEEIHLLGRPLHSVQHADHVDAAHVHLLFADDDAQVAELLLDVHPDGSAQLGRLAQTAGRSRRCAARGGGRRGNSRSRPTAGRRLGR